MDSAEKGAAAEESVAIILRHLKSEGIKEVRWPLYGPERTSRDMLVTLDNGMQFGVQVKWDSVSNRVLKDKKRPGYAVERLNIWITLTTPTILVWNDGSKSGFFWCDIVRYLFRKGGIRSLRELYFADDDRNWLDVNAVDSRQSFLAHVRFLCQIWPGSQDRLQSIYSDVEFPPSLVDVLKDTTIVEFLPVSARLLNLVRDRSPDTAYDKLGLLTDLFEAGRISVNKGASQAALLLCNKRSIADEDVRKEISKNLELWSARLKTEQRIPVASTLWAFDQLVNVVTYDNRKSLVFPTFTSSYTYPLGRLVRLLPPDALIEAFENVLGKDNDSRALQYMVYLLGIINHTDSVGILKILRQFRSAARRRRDAIGYAFPSVERQCLYSMDQLAGGQEGALQTEFLRKLQTPDGLAFDAAYNYYVYYNRNWERIVERYERRVEENLKTDQPVRKALSISWENIKRLKREDSPVLLRYDPGRWPTG